MIEGRRPNGYLVTCNEFGGRVEKETRQCVHCQFTWDYDPHEEARARTLRGFCLRCYGYTCERHECHLQMKNLVREFPEQGDCMPYERYIHLRLQRIANHPLWEVTPTGLIVPKADENLPLPIGGITY